MIEKGSINNKFFKADVRVMLSMLWLFILINIFFRDIHEFIKAEFLQEALSGTIGGIVVTEGLLFIGGIVAVLSALMVILSATLKHKPNRIMNLVFSPLFALSFVTNGFNDADDLLHLTVELIALVLIFVIASRWKNS